MGQKLCSALTRAARCGIRCRGGQAQAWSCRRKKLKIGDAEEALVDGGTGASPHRSQQVAPLTSDSGDTGGGPTGGCDPYDGGNPVGADVPGWQMPKLVIECSRRAGARIHKGTSVILPDAGGDLIAGIVSQLPVLLQFRPCWHLGYSLAVDGVSLRTLYRQLEEVGPCLLVVEDSSSCIFGAFVSDGLKAGGHCYGDQECFVFRYPRSAGAWRTEVYGWVAPPQVSAPSEESELQGPHWNNYADALRKCQSSAVAAPICSVVYCDYAGMLVGIDGPALFVDQNLLRGVSKPCPAFGSPTLSAAGPDFVVRNLEVWHWESPF